MGDGLEGTGPSTAHACPPATLLHTPPPLTHLPFCHLHTCLAACLLPPHLLSSCLYIPACLHTTIYTYYTTTTYHYLTGALTSLLTVHLQRAFVYLGGWWRYTAAYAPNNLE